MLFDIGENGLNDSASGVGLSGGIVVLAGEKGEPIVAIGFGEGGEVGCGGQSGVLSDEVGIGEGIDLEGDLIAVGEGFEVGEGSGEIGRVPDVGGEEGVAGRSGIGGTSEVADVCAEPRDIPGLLLIEFGLRDAEDGTINES